MHLRKLNRQFSCNFVRQDTALFLIKHLSEDNKNRKQKLVYSCNCWCYIWSCEGSCWC